MFLPGRCLALLLTRLIPRGRGHLLKHLRVKEHLNLQQEELLVAVAAEGRQPLGEAKGAVCLEEEDLGLLPM
jgi:hypothetical protein